jgi:hypothetical protein
MSRISFACCLSVALLLFCAALAANFTCHMPQMRGAWVARSLG